MNIEDINVGDLLRVRSYDNIYKVTGINKATVDVKYIGMLVGVDQKL